MFDPEVPSGCQDADFEMMEFRRAAREEEAAIKAGNCPHSHTGPVEKNWTVGCGRPTKYQCYECGKEWDTAKERDNAIGWL